MNPPPGFHIPIHRSLWEPLLLAGAPRAVTIVNATIAAAIGLGAQVWWAGALIWIAAHGIAVLLTRRDPDVFAIWARHVKYPSHLEV